MGAGRPKSISNTRVFDVARPGKSKPVGTSRPVIINHEKAVTDRMVVPVQDGSAPRVITSPSKPRKIINPISISSSDDDAPAAETADKTTKAKKSSVATKKPAKAVPVTPDIPKVDETPVIDDTKLQELVQSASVKTEQTVEKTAPEVPVTSMLNEVEEEQVPESFEEQTKETIEDKTPSDETEEYTEETTESQTYDEQEKDKTTDPETETLVTDTLETSDEDAKKMSVSTQKEEAEKAAKEAELQKLIDSKKYFVPLAHDSTKRSSRKAPIFVLFFLLLAVVGVYVAIDANLLQINITLPYDFIK